MKKLIAVALVEFVLVGLTFFLIFWVVSVPIDPLKFTLICRIPWPVALVCYALLLVGTGLLWLYEAKTAPFQGQTLREIKKGRTFY
jgi:hypothetical protein